jgi:hypothetical protein
MTNEAEREAFEKWHGGRYLGLQRDIAWAAWIARALSPTARAPDPVREALQECLTTMQHARVFVMSRERIKVPEGADLYDEALANARAALGEKAPQPSLGAES